MDYKTGYEQAVKDMELNRRITTLEQAVEFLLKKEQDKENGVKQTAESTPARK